MSKPQSHTFPNPPASTEYSEQADEVVTSLLNQFVIQQHLIETPQQQQQRADVINDLEQRISQWVYDTYRTTYMQYMSSYRSNLPSTRLVLIQPYGSYFLQTHSATSDIDAVVVFPQYVNEKTFFETFTIQLRQTRGVERAEYIQAKFSLINVVYNGVEIDLQPAMLNKFQVNRNIDWLDTRQFDECSPKAKSAIAAVTTNAYVKHMMQQQFPLFQQLVRILKYSSDKLMITGNKFGYFGGINIVLMAAHIMTIAKEPMTLAQLVYSFFRYYASFDFGRKPIILNEEVGYMQNINAPMQIVTVTKPEINSTAKVTESTRYVIQRQFNEARRSMEYLFKLVATCIDKEKPTARLLLKPSILDMIFMKLMDPPEKQQAAYQIVSHAEYFFKDPELKNIMVLKVQAKTIVLLKQVVSKVEPQLTYLFNELEKLKIDSGSVAKVHYVRPNPAWEFSTSQPRAEFYIGIAKTAGDKSWLGQKLADVIKQLKLRLRNSMEREEVEVQTIVQGMIIEVVSGSKILKAREVEMQGEKTDTDAGQDPKVQ